MDLTRRLKRVVERTGFTVSRVETPTRSATAAEAAVRPRPRPRGKERPRAGSAGKAAPAPAAATAVPQPAVAKVPLREVTKTTPDMIRPPANPQLDRLLSRPIFILSPVRSGSTLLRSVLNAHSELHAPHELHLPRLTVHVETLMAERALAALGHNQADLEHLLWDRVLHLELERSGKRYVVEKTPEMVSAHRRIATCWPDARFIFLIRHPASIAQSWREAGGAKKTFEERTVVPLRLMQGVQRARAELDGLTVRYEDLTVDPGAETQRICEFLELPWEPGMLDYGQDGVFVRGLGDWKDKIRSGTVQPGRALPEADEVPPMLRDISSQWGYL